MTEVLQSQQRFPSTLSPIMSDDELQQPPLPLYDNPFINITDCYSLGLDSRGDTEILGRDLGEEGDQVSLLKVLVTVFRKSLVAACRSDIGVQVEKEKMKISWPTNVRHVSHVTFDRFHGFLGLPVEFEPEVPRRPPSASTRVFGVSTVSMQLSFDSRGNSVPTILLMMQSRLYAEGGLQAEGIFRINPDNAQEEHVREQLNMGVVPDDVDIHCLAGLIKAWFRELPTALLDCFPPEEVMQAQSEEQCAQLVKLLPPTEAALLDWAINLMADVAEMEPLNKMNARNIAMVFAPNMTKMADPLTALMFAVQVMNFLKTLIERTLKDRQDSPAEIPRSLDHLGPSDENGDQGMYSQLKTREKDEECEGGDQLKDSKNVHSCTPDVDDCLKQEHQSDEKENVVKQSLAKDSSKQVKLCKDASGGGRYQSKSRRTRIRQTSNTSAMKGPKKLNELAVIQTEKGKECSNIGRITAQTERVEAWR